MLPVTMTSNCFGLRTSCIAALSTYMCDSATSGYSAASALTVSRHRMLVSSTLALSTEHSRLLALARRLEPDARDALDLRHAVVHRVEAFASPRALRAAAARLAEVDVAGQLAHDHEVEPGDDVGLERRSGGELGIQDRRTQVREQAAAPCGCASNALLGAHVARQRVVLRAADGAHQHRVGRLRERERGAAAADGRPRRSRRRRSAPSRSSIGSPSSRSTLEHALRLSDDLGADAVARQDCDLHAFPVSISKRAAPLVPWRRFSWRSSRARAGRRAVSSRTRESRRRAAA